MKYRTKDGEEFEADDVKGIKELMALAAGKTKEVTEVQAKESGVAVKSSVTDLLKKDEWNLSRENKKWKPAEKKRLLSGWQPIGTGMPNPIRLQHNYRVAKMLKRGFGACRFVHSQLTKPKE